MRQEAEAYTRLMDSEGIRHDDIVTLNSGKFDVETRWNLEDTTIAVRAIFDDEGHTVAIRCFRLAHIRGDSFDDVLKTCNELNNRFRWVKFSIDNDNDINMEIDCIVNEDTAGEVVLELVRRLCGIADEAYPELMKIIYGCKSASSHPDELASDSLE